MTVCFPKKINLTFKDQVSSLEGLHRHGMKLVYDALFVLHSDTAETKCDLNLESTFLSEQSTYTSPFIGFLHNSFIEYSDNNLQILFENANFLQSLAYCRGLFVFSDHVKDYIKTKLCLVDHSDIPVWCIMHPTEIDVPKFTMSAFQENDDKVIAQIGYWMRDLLGIFMLETGKEIVLETGDILKKRILVPPQTELFESEEELIANGDICFFTSRPASTSLSRRSAFRALSGPISRPISRPVNLDYEISILEQLAESNPDFSLQFARQKLESSAEVVQEINTLTDEQYDDLLTKNVVFLKLYDAVAVNTVLECFARTTPIFLNRLPALEQLLGSTYPGFYDDLESFKITDSLIKESHIYLKNRKIDLSVEKFLRHFVFSNVYSLLPF